LAIRQHSYTVIII